MLRGGGSIGVFESIDICNHEHNDITFKLVWQE